MPRITKDALAAAIAEHPFSPYLDPTDPRAFANLSASMQKAIVFAIYEDFKVRGIGAPACRAKYGGTSDANPAEFNRGLSGDRRRELFLEYGKRDGIAKSYENYRNGNPRKGSAHARTQGEAFAAVAAEAARKLAEEDRKAQSKEMRKALRESGVTPSRSDAKMRAQFDSLSALPTPADADES